jgi:hypothetical protein
LNGKDPAHEAQWRGAEAGAKALNLNLVRVEANGPSGIDAAHSKGLHERMPGGCSCFQTIRR